MILERVSVRNWRGVRDERAVEFAEGLNLLVGPNEAGKTSLLEAVLRGLLDRHTSRTKDLREIRPWGSSLAPEVCLVLRAGGTRLRVEKRFLHEPSARVFAERNGRFELDHEGDRADQYLRKLLLEESARGSAKASHRGIAQALWYLQRDEPLPRQWSSALEEGLAGLVGNVLTDRLQDRVLARLRSELEATYTPTGRLKARSELKAALDETETLTAELAERQLDIERAQLYREELEELASRRRELEGELAKVRSEGSSLDERSADAPELEAQIKELTRRSEDLQRSRADGERHLVELRENAARIEAIAQQLEQHEDAEAKLRVAVREQRRAAERHARRWEDDLRPKLEAVRAEIEDLRTKMRIEQLELDLAEVDRRAARIVQLESQLAEQLARESELRTFEAEDPAEARRLEERLSVLRSRAEAAAIVVEWALDRDAQLRVEPDDAPETREPRRLITRPTVLHIEGVGSLHVRSNDQQLEEMDREARLTEERLRALLEKCAAESVAQLVERAASLQRVQRRIAELRARLAETSAALLDGSDAASDSERARLTGDAEPGGTSSAADSLSTVFAARRRDLAQELEALRAVAPQAVLPGMEGWAEERTLDQLRALEERRGRLDRQIREEREAEQTAQQACLERNEELVSAGQRAAALRAERGAHRVELEKRRATFGEQEAQEKALRALEREFTKVGEQLEEAREQWQERVEAPRARRAELAAREAALVERLGELGAQRADRQARIEEVTALGLDGRIGDLEGRLAVTRERAEALSRRAEATKMLDTLLRVHEAERSASLVEPVRDLVNRWLAQITEERYRGVTLGDDLVPSGVEPAGFDEAKPLESLSHGSYEQLAVLLRLALGVLLSGEERQLVVIDDGLVNADAKRQQAFLPILEEAAEHCQVIVATCRPVAYDGLDAHTVELDRTSRWSPRLLAGGDTDRPAT